jgi:tetratricopeptide (TPR) repeat protein
MFASTKLVICILFFAVPSSHAESVEALIARGDRLEEQGKFNEAIAVYKMIPKSAEGDVLWRLSRVYVDMAETSSHDEQEKLYEEALRYSRRAVEVAANSAESHAALAIVLAKRALSEGLMNKIELAITIKQEAEKAMSLNPGYPVPYIVLGAWHREVSKLNFFQRAGAQLISKGLPDASIDRSADYLQRAVQLAPTNLRGWYELGLTYKEMGKKQEAADVFRKLLSMPDENSLDRLVKRDARRALGQ